MDRLSQDERFTQLPLDVQNRINALLALFIMAKIPPNSVTLSALLFLVDECHVDIAMKTQTTSIN